MTCAERLDRLIQRLAPQAWAACQASGEWPVVPPGVARQAPYVIDTLAGDRRRIRVETEGGDVISGVGATVDTALTALEQKVPS